MREIKFRAWDKERKKIVIPEIINLSEQKAQIKYSTSSTASSGNTYVAYEWIELSLLMQFTGIYDKNKKPVFEGDILEFFTKDRESPYYVKNAWTYIVSIENLTSGYRPAIEAKRHKSDHGFHPFYSCEDSEFRDMSDIEIIGNIYEHPDLLKD